MVVDPNSTALAHSIARPAQFPDSAGTLDEIAGEGEVGRIGDEDLAPAVALSAQSDPPANEVPDGYRDAAQRTECQADDVQHLDRPDAQQRVA